MVRPRSLSDWLDEDPPSISADTHSPVNVQPENDSGRAEPLSLSLSSVKGSVTVGVDTFSVAWSAHLPQRIARLLRTALDEPLPLGVLRFRKTRAGMVRSDSHGGLVYGVSLGRGYGDDGPSTVWIEGRASEPGELSSVGGVERKVEEALTVLDECGFEPFGPPEPLTDLEIEWPSPTVRRLDLAADFRIPETDGQQLLNDLARCELAWPYDKRRVYETVASRCSTCTGLDIRLGNNVALRAYCKATETAERARSPRPVPGGWVRIERQLRYAGKKRPPMASTLHGRALGAMWVSPISRLLESTTTFPDALAAVMDKLSAGAIEYGHAQRMVGWLLLKQHDLDDLTPSTRQRRMSDLAALGIRTPTLIAPSPITSNMLAEAAALWELWD